MSKYLFFASAYALCTSVVMWFSNHYHLINTGDAETMLTVAIGWAIIGVAVAVIEAITKKRSAS